MIAGAFDDGGGAGVAHRKAFASDAAEIAFANNRAIEHRVADDDAVFGHDRRLGVRAHDQLAARKALADIVVAFADEIERDAGGRPCAERLACRAVERQPDGVLRQADVAISAGNFPRQHRAGRAVDVFDREFGFDGLAVVQCGLGDLDQLVVENFIQPVVLPFAVVNGDAFGRGRLVEELREIEPARLPMFDGAVFIEVFCSADQFA